MTDKDTVSLRDQFAMAALKTLTPVQKKFVLAGTFHGDFTMTTVRALTRKGLFQHNATSPNGRCGPMVLTQLGEAVRAMLSTRSRNGGEGE